MRKSELGTERSMKNLLEGLQREGHVELKLGKSH